MNTKRFCSWVATVALILGSVARYHGHGRDLSDFVLPEKSALGIERAFYQFHPDEETLVRAALQLDTPLLPPITAYGMFPIYMVRGVLEVLASAHRADLEELYQPALNPQLYGAVRGLSALLSICCLFTLWFLARTHFPPSVAALATVLMAAFPIAIQLAHYFTVDGVFALLSVLATAAFVRATRSRRRTAYIVSGICIGLAAAVRLNGLLLGLTLLVAHAGSGSEGPSPRARLKHAVGSEMWWAGVTALATLFLLQPYLILDPELLMRAETSNDFGFSALVARGEILRPWSLFDLSTPPYTHYLTKLIPLAAGWPFACILIPATARALWRGNAMSTVCATWLILYFASIGGQHTKHVRYLLPMLPMASLLVAEFCIALFRRLESGPARGLAVAAIVLLAGYTSLYGAAFANIYSTEDSRIAAGRWIHERVPAGASIGLERGGFSLWQTVSAQRYRHVLIETGSHFGSRGYLSCRAAARSLQARLLEIDYLVIADENRSRQFRSAPKLYPALSSFYEHLPAGGVGYEPVARFKQIPVLFGVRFDTGETDPSFAGYDHPEVMILRRKSGFPAEYAAWTEMLLQDERCVDGDFEQAASAVRQSRSSAAEHLLQRIRRRNPDALYVLLLEAEHRRLQLKYDAENEALEGFMQGYSDRSRSMFLIPWATASSYAAVGLYDLASSALRDGVHKSVFVKERSRRKMASSYIDIANQWFLQNETSRAEQVYQMANGIWPEATAHNALALIAYDRGHFASAASHWKESLVLDPAQADVHRYLGEVAAHQLNDPQVARFHLQRAGHLNPQLKSELEIVLRKLNRQQARPAAETQ